jgi:hypothetical protein
MSLFALRWDNSYGLRCSALLNARTEEEAVELAQAIGAYPSEQELAVTFLEPEVKLCARYLDS